MNIHRRSLRGRFMITAVAALLAGSAIPVAGPQADRLRVRYETTAVQEVELGDGTKLLGRIVRIDGDDIFFRTLGNVAIQFERRDVRSVREVQGEIYDGEFWPDDPSDSRLFLAPTARVPGHGHGYFGVYELVVPSFGVGIGNVFMISGGFSDNPLLMVGGEVRATKRLKLITENWIAPSESDAILSLGFRIITSRLTVEVAVATTTEGGFLPLVNFSTAW